MADPTTKEQMRARIHQLEEQRQKYWRHMWHAASVLREYDAARADELVREWDPEAPLAAGTALLASTDQKGGDRS